MNPEYIPKTKYPMFQRGQSQCNRPSFGLTSPKLNESAQCVRTSLRSQLSPLPTRSTVAGESRSKMNDSKRAYLLTELNLNGSTFF